MNVVDAGAPGAIEHAADVLAGGGLVAFPTDTIYGLGASVRLPPAIERLFIAKGRPRDRAIPVLIASAGELQMVAETIQPRVSRLASAFWPGPLTIVVPRRSSLPAVLGPTPTVGVRVPDHPVALALLRMAGPLAVTSANLSGNEGSQTAEQVAQALGDRVDLILDGGRSPGGLASTVVDCSVEEARILRQGPIELAALQEHFQDGVS